MMKIEKAGTPRRGSRISTWRAFSRFFPNKAADFRKIEKIDLTDSSVSLVESAWYSWLAAVRGSSSDMLGH